MKISRARGLAVESTLKRYESSHKIWKLSIKKIEKA